MIQFKSEQFEGPLDLLLRMIEKEELDITQISLAKIADQYVSYIKSSPNIKPDDMADFLVVAARLLLIKSKALLPYLFPEEEKEIEEFEQQLKMYKEFLDATKKIQALIGRKKFMFVREFNRKAVLSNASFFAPPKNTKSEDLCMVFGDLLTRLQPVEELEEKRIERKISIDDKIYHIQEMLVKRMNFSFNHITDNAESKTEVIVCFLALLELVKQKDLIAKQDGLFSEIIVNRYKEETEDGLNAEVVGDNGDDSKIQME